MSDTSKMLNNPKVREALKVKLEQIRSQKVVKVEAELVVEGETGVVVKKPKFMDLATSEHYIETFINKTPQEISDFIDKQSDMLMMYSKNAALELLAKAVEDNDGNALEMYLKVVQASAVVAQEKVAVKKMLGVTGEDAKPKQYKAPEMSQEEWEKQFKPGQPVIAQEPEKEQKWIGVGTKSVN